MDQEKPVGSYRIESMILLSSSFERESIIDFNQPIELQFSHSSQATETDEFKKFAVSLSFDIKGVQGETNVFAASTNMVGSFEKIGEPVVSEENFRKINAPAIIYPFIREHVHNLCAKAAVGVILLPTVNFKI
ncbi:protein-export chaperone SecB [Sediminibacterium soli]|uniref:protein-export chaperone SecB n=1 Tax=Sediminibacterium soli TaxID=2698829 RepID=UPI0013795A7B|nr:protein-export chaperone SecB [Sediminibacterium soli]NCI48231.1 hypothetical protein [Sediminibacterium soli]